MRKLLPVILVVFVMLNLWLICRLSSSQNALQSLQTSYEELDKKSNTVISNLSTSQLLGIRMSGQPFMGIPSTIDSLKRVIGSRPKLFLNISQYSCESCIDRAVMEITQLAAKIGYENLVILSYYENRRDAMYIAKRLEDKVRVFNCPSYSRLYINEYFQAMPPNFFIMDSKLLPTHLFIYSIDLPNLNQAYFDVVVQYLERVGAIPKR